MPAGVPKPPAIKPSTFPAPYQGINAVDPLASLDANQACTYSTNLIPEGRGLRVRSGYKQFATGIDGTQTILTVMPFQASVTANDKLFVTTTNGIFDITAGGVIGAAAIAFATVDGTSGIGIWTNFVIDNGAHVCIYADETNGIYEYTEGGAWARITGAQITGVNPNNLVFVMQFKSRLWFVERNCGRGWYLPVGAVIGAATRFDFGNKFNHGGSLVGMWSWTIDGGSGLDDLLVGVSAGGDVLIYKGTDPTSASTFGAVGQYFIGPVPAGRRQASNFGGELFILSQYGVLPMSALIAGRPVDEQDVYASRNISPLISTDMNNFRTQRGWEMRNIPGENVFLVATPKQTNFPYKQYARSSKSRGWGIWQDVPYVTGDTWQGSFYVGSTGGVVYRITGNTDAVTLAGTGGVNIQFSLLTAFSEFGETSLYHQVQFIRPVFRAAAAPTLSTQARYDYNTDDVTGGSVSTAITTYTWDAAASLWDTALWGGDSTTIQSVSAGNGIGRAMGIAILGTSQAETILVRIDILFTSGGPL